MICINKADEIRKKILDNSATPKEIKKLIEFDRLNPLVNEYANLVNSNNPWEWKYHITGGDSLTKTQKKKIKSEAINRGLIPNVKMKPGIKYPDFESEGVIKRIDYLPQELWESSDTVQFRWLDDRIAGGRPKGFTWHHSEIDGRMELVPFGIHNVINHIGGRSKGHWAFGKR